MKIGLADRAIELTENEADDLRYIGWCSKSAVWRCAHAALFDDHGEALVGKGVVERVSDRLRLTLDGCDALHELASAEVRRAAEQPAQDVAVEAAS